VFKMLKKHKLAGLAPEEKMADIAAEVRAAFAAIMDAIPPIPPEVSNAFLAIGAAGLLILVVSVLNMWGK
jgi:hypothetical protein